MTHATVPLGSKANTVRQGPNALAERRLVTAWAFSRPYPTSGRLAVQAQWAQGDTKENVLQKSQHTWPWELAAWGSPEQGACSFFVRQTVSDSGIRHHPVVPVGDAPHPDASSQFSSSKTRN